MIRRQLFPALVLIALFTVVLGLAYPLTVTAIAQLTMKDKANGSLVRSHGEVVGSRLIGQAFTEPSYFQPRPSAAGDGYDAMSSGGSNLGPSSDDLADEVERRATAYRVANDLAPDADVPVDAVTASGSGLDPHISIENARLQTPRVARERGLAPSRVTEMVDAAVDDRSLGVLGQPGVNVLELNIALDAAG